MRRTWTKEKCREIALRYSSRAEFYKNEWMAYQAMQREGWIEDLAGHQIKAPKRKKRIWTTATIAEAALSCGTRREFSEKFCSAYNAALYLGCLDDVCKHMVPKHQSGYRWIYGYFSLFERMAYIGLTKSISERRMQHFTTKNSAVQEICKNLHEFRIISGPHTFSDAPAAERSAMEHFKGLGWTLKNKVAGGSLGGRSTMWSKARCMKAAEQAGSMPEFRRQFTGAYLVSLKNGWIDEVAQVCPRAKVPSGYWSKERCVEHAMKFTTRHQFKLNDSKAYRAAQTRGWLDDVCSHMPVPARSPISFLQIAGADEIVCVVCKLVKAKSEFGKRPTVSHGCQRRCRSCERANDAIRRKKKAYARLDMKERGL